MATLTKPQINIAPYNSNVYNSVNYTLRVAVQKAQERNIQLAINTVIRDCFIKHHIEKDFSASLIHRHYDLATNERNVESDGKAVASKDLDGIYPSSWMFYQGRCYPYEYKRYAVPQPPTAFITDLGEVLESQGICDLVGLQTYTDGVIGLESTDYETNVSTTVEQGEEAPVPAGMAPASWAFFQV